MKWRLVLTVALFFCNTQQAFAYRPFFVNWEGGESVIGEAVCTTFEAAREYDGFIPRYFKGHMTDTTPREERERLFRSGTCFFGIMKWNIPNPSSRASCMGIIEVKGYAVRDVPATFDNTLWKEERGERLLKLAEEIHRGELIPSERLFVPSWNTGLGVDSEYDVCAPPVRNVFHFRQGNKKLVVIGCVDHDSAVQLSTRLDDKYDYEMTWLRLSKDRKCFGSIVPVEAYLAIQGCPETYEMAARAFPNQKSLHEIGVADKARKGRVMSVHVPKGLFSGRGFRLIKCYHD